MERSEPWSPDAEPWEALREAKGRLLASQEGFGSQRLVDALSEMGWRLVPERVHDAALYRADRAEELLGVRERDYEREAARVRGLEARVERLRAYARRLESGQEAAYWERVDDRREIERLREALLRAQRAVDDLVRDEPVPEEPELGTNPTPTGVGAPAWSPEPSEAATHVLCSACGHTHDLHDREAPSVIFGTEESCAEARRVLVDDGGFEFAAPVLAEALWRTTEILLDLPLEEVDGTFRAGFEAGVSAAGQAVLGGERWTEAVRAIFDQSVADSAPAPVPVEEPDGEPFVPALTSASNDGELPPAPDPAGEEE